MKPLHVLAIVFVFVIVAGAVAAETDSGSDKPTEQMTREEIEAGESSEDPLVRIKGYTAHLTRKDCLRSVVLEGRAAAYLCAGQLDKALSDLDDIIKPRGGVLTSYLLRGQVRFLQGKYQEALDDFARGGPSIEDLQPMVWAELCRMRMGKASGKALADALKHSELPEGDSCRERARLYSGRGSVHAYCDAVRKEIKEYQPPEREDAQDADSRKYSAKEREEVKENHRQRRNAEAAFYIGEYYLGRGQKKIAEKWLQVAADYKGTPEGWFLIIGRGSIAEQELKKLREDKAKALPQRHRED